MPELRLGAETPRPSWHVYDFPLVAVSMANCRSKGRGIVNSEQEKVLKVLKVPLFTQHQRSTVLQFTSLSANLLFSTASYD
jgi:hypothetical protein